MSALCETDDRSQSISETLGQMERLSYRFINQLRKIKHASQAVILLLLDSLVFLVPAGMNRSRKEKILFVKLDRIGDFILWLDAAQEIRKLYPDGKYEITLLGNELWTELAEGPPIFDQVWRLDKKKLKNNFIYRFGTLRKIRKAGFDIVIHPVSSREIWGGDSIVRLSCARQRIGSLGDYMNIEPWQKRISDRWYTKLIPVSKDSLMELERNAEFMRGLGAIEARARVPHLASTSYSRDCLKEPYIIVFPSASEPIKQWPVENFLEIVKKIHEKVGCAIVLCGGPEDYLLGKRIEEGRECSVINKIGKTSLIDLTSLIAGARILIGNDTSAIHIAAAVSTPSICIAGGGHYGRFVPYAAEAGPADNFPIVVTSKKDCFGCNWRCIYPRSKYKPAPCISGVSISEVWDAIASTINVISAAERNNRTNIRTLIPADREVDV